jgi:Asp-tRNA(Asn)/Glu-tRNA(Gln) amidotransferase A subunit family amidase
LIRTHGFEPETPRERRRWEKAAVELERLGASGTEYERRASAYQQQHPTWAFTPRAIVGRWGELGAGAAAAAQRPPEQQLLRWAKSAAAKFDPETFHDLLDQHYGELPTELLDQALAIYQANHLEEAC